MISTRWNIVSILLIGLFALPAAGQQSTPTKIWDCGFTSAQGARGKVEFDANCSRSHNVALIGSERGPAIKGRAFLAQWEKDNLAGLFIKIRDTMPQGGSGTVREEVKIDILSYILQQNG